MDALTVSVVQQIFTVAAAALASGIVTSLLTQALKWKAIKVPAQKYPVVVAAVLSLIVSAGAVYLLGAILLTSVVSYIVFSAATLLVATQSYDVVKKAIEQKDEA